MSGLILRCCRRGVAGARLLPAPSCRSRHFSSGSVSPWAEKPRDNMDKFLIGSLCVVSAAVTKIYLDFLKAPLPAISTATIHHNEEKKHEVAEAKEEEPAEAPSPQPEEAQPEKSDVEKMYEEQLKEIEGKFEEELKAAQSKAEDSEARALRLQKELENENAKHAEELKAQADMISGKLQQEIQSLKNEIDAKNSSSDIGKEKLRLANEITELKQQIESLGFSGSDLDKSFLLRKLATVMGVFAFERAMMNGEPLENEIASLQGGDALINAAISSLPQDAVKGGSLTPLELQSRFVNSKDKLRELALVPASGGGAVSHLIARGATNLKVKEENSNDDGSLESVFDRVESLIKQNNLLEAGKVLEEAVQGTEAEALAGEWAAQARLRASVEQVYDVLRAHAASISMSFA